MRNRTELLIYIYREREEEREIARNSLLPFGRVDEDLRGKNGGGGGANKEEETRTNGLLDTRKVG